MVSLLTHSVVYIFFFASTFGPGAWVVTGEIFPLKARAKCLSMTTAANWFFNWLLAFITPYLEGKQYANLGSNVFWIWGGFCWIAVSIISTNRCSDVKLLTFILTDRSSSCTS